MDWISVDDKLPDAERGLSLCVKTSTGDIYYSCNYIGKGEWNTFLINANHWRYLYHINTDRIVDHPDGSGKKITIGIAGMSIEKNGIITHWAVDNNRG